tara:strand:- start:57 stop:1130 length:1074 start_codon:yes stop_codon:yes gene_type:complete
MINIISPINTLGYGIVGINLVKSLSRKTDVALKVIGSPSLSSEEDEQYIQKAFDNGHFPDWEAPCIRIWHQHDMSEFVGRGEKIGFPIFELDRFKPIEKHHLSYLDKIFVCSEWAKKIVCEQVGRDEKDVKVIPLGVDPHIFRPSTIDKQENNATIFFNCGKWEVRKGHDVLIKAFNRAFSSEDNVELWMMCDNPFYTEQESADWENVYKSSPLGDKVSLINRVQTTKEVYNIMSLVDCGVFPSRAEGWNLELLELMACGKHVIATDFSAHTEFCSKDNAYLVSIDKTEKAFDGKWFDGKTGNWAHIGDDQINQIADHMKNIHELKQSGSLGINNGGLEAAGRFTWDNSAVKILENV